jgi:hypothetical protein
MEQHPFPFYGIKISLGKFGISAFRGCRFVPLKMASLKERFPKEIFPKGRPLEIFQKISFL